MASRGRRSISIGNSAASTSSSTELSGSPKSSWKLGQGLSDSLSAKEWKKQEEGEWKTWALSEMQNK